MVKQILLEPLFLLLGLLLRFFFTIPENPTRIQRKPGRYTFMQMITLRDILYFSIETFVHSPGLFFSSAFQLTIP